MKWWKSAIFLVIFLSVTRAAPTPLVADESLRLPKTSVPLTYELNLEVPGIHQGQRSYTGTVTIKIEITSNTDKITLHNHGLTAGTIMLKDSGFIDVYDHFEDEEQKEFIHIFATRDLTESEKLTLEIAFSGQIQTNMRGFYRSSYKLNNGAIR